jgi:uncharacterized repeat protein (TIGR02543 family)
MKKIICYSLMFLLVITLSLFINIKTGDKIEVHASGPKIFEVGEVLPATTQLRISWVNFERFGGDIIHYIRTNFDFIEIKDNDPYFGYFNIRSPYFPFTEFYTNSYDWFIEGDCSHIINTSLWTEQERTVTLVDLELSMFTWEDLAPSYTITFETNGGTTFPDIEVATELPNPLPIPTKSGYTFRGWYYDSDFTNEALAGDPLTGDVTLYAKWQKNYRIFYNSNGGNTIPSITTDIIPDNLPIPKRNDDIFIGWYYDESLSDPVETNDILSSDITLYASWIDYDSIIEYFYDIYKNGYDDGYDDTYNDSFNQGYDLGFAYGYPYGYDDGYRDGLMEDHPIEFQEFFDKGFFDARDKYGKQLDDSQWESAQIAYENGQKTMGRYSKILMYGIVIITIIGGVLLYFSFKRRNE